MAEYSGYDWLASKTAAGIPGGISPINIRGNRFIPGVRNGDAHVVLSYVAVQFDLRVEKVDFGHPQDDWGWNYRPNRNNPNSLSRHSAAIAIDYNATRHPNGKRGTFSAAQVAEIRKILAEVDGVVRWGGDFSGTKDEMHVELNASQAAVARVAARLRGGKVTPGPVPAPVNTGTVTVPVVIAHRKPDRLPELRRGDKTGWTSLLQYNLGITRDSDFGPGTERAVRTWQQRFGLGVDGIVGPKTWVSFLAAAGTLQSGSKGAAVEVLQNMLGFRPGAGLDGDFGLATETRVREVQAWGGIATDGKVGPATHAVLLRA